MFASLQHSFHAINYSHYAQSFTAIRHKSKFLSSVLEKVEFISAVINVERCEFIRLMFMTDSCV